MAIGSILLGGVADKIGRRPTTLGCLLVMALGMFMVTTSSGWIGAGVAPVLHVAVRARHRRAAHRSVGLARDHRARHRRHARRDQRRCRRILEREEPAFVRVADVDRLPARRGVRRHRGLAALGRSRLARGVLFRRGRDRRDDSARVLLRARDRALARASPAAGSARAHQSHAQAHGSRHGQRAAHAHGADAQALDRRCVQARSRADHRTRDGRLFLPHHDVLFHREVGAEDRRRFWLRGILGRLRARLDERRRRDRRRGVRFPHASASA